MVILYYEIHSFRIIYVPGCNVMFDYVRITFAEHWMMYGCRVVWVPLDAEQCALERMFSNSKYAKKSGTF